MTSWIAISMTDPSSAATLDGAASSLLAVAYGDPHRVSPGVRLHCLCAVELLHGAGAAASTHEICDDNPRELILAALRQLGSLPLEVFTQDAVLDAAAAARAALHAIG